MQTAKVYEYEVYLMDDTKKSYHKGPVILATDNLAVACSYCYDYFNKFGISIGVYQPRTEGYREHYRAKPWRDIAPSPAMLKLAALLQCKEAK